MIEDAELLRRYAEEKSEAAFAELVQRRIGLVYAVALRHTRDAARAEDVAQRVFCDLARKASALARRPALVGWLHKSAHFAASDAMRAERRRKQREQEAHLMQEIEREGTEPNWENLRPLLDDLLNSLPESDRDAVLMRFSEGRPLAEIGAQLRLGENTVRMRIERALEKLRTRLARRGVTSTTAALGSALGAHAGLAAPSGLAATVTGAALAGAATSASGAALLAFLTMNKIKVGLVTALLLATCVPALVELRAHQRLTAELKALDASATGAQVENRHLMEALASVGAGGSTPNATKDLERWRARAALLRSRPDGVVEAEMKPPTNAGWETPEAAFETLNWAVVNGDWALLANAWTLRGETKTVAATFFAGLNAEAREKYGTPERLIAHALIAASFPQGREWMTAMQVYDSQIVDGTAPRHVRIWQRLGNGREFTSEATFERGEDGRWVAAQEGMTRIVEKLLPMLDPQTGELRPKQP